jgi:PAS domain S-box-containing protein
MDHLPVGILISLDSSGQVLIGNRMAREITGLSASQRFSTEMPVFRTFHAGITVRSEQLPWRRAVKLRRAISTADYEVWRADGTRRIVAMASEPLVDEHGYIQGAVSSLTDVTYLRTQERRMRGERDLLAELMAREHQVVRTLEYAHLPYRMPSVPGFRINGLYLAASNCGNLGGDWYDAFPLRDGRIGFSIGDVMGHGLDVAVIMGKLRHAMHSVAFVQPTPVSMLDAANATLLEYDEDLTTTAIAGILDPADATLTFATAGHPLPLLRTSDGDLVAFEGAAPPLGLYEDGDARNHFAHLDPGDLAVFYTDGLVEATRDVTLGENLLRQTLLALGAQETETPRAILNGTLFGMAPPEDDIALLTIAREPLAA